MRFSMISIIIVFLLVWRVPSLLQNQRSAKITELQNLLNHIAERFLEKPFFFYDIYMKDELTHYPSMWSTRFELNAKELRKIFPDYHPAKTTKDKVFYFEGGPAGANKKFWRNYNEYNPERHWVYVFVNINGMKYDYSYGNKQGKMTFPPPKYKYQPSNGLDSQGILYAHTYELYQTDKK